MSNTGRTTARRAFFLGVVLGFLPLSSSAQTAACQSPDPAQFEEVFACMMSLRHPNPRQKPVFEGLAMTSCENVAVPYWRALQKSGNRGQELGALIPSCPMFARAFEQIRGTKPSWGACTRYPGRFDEAHLKACLDTYLPGHYGKTRTFQSLGGCADIITQYEKALAAAHIRPGGSPKRSLPDGYQKPDCTLLAALTTGPQGSSCLGYTPGPAHVQACLGGDITRFTECPALRRAYEQELRQAYGGVLPEGYVPMTCEAAKPFTDEAQKKRDEERTLAETQRRAARPPPSARPSQQGWIQTGRAALGLVPGAAFFLHLALAVATLLYASRLIRSGRWTPHARSIRVLLPGQPLTLVRAAHGVLAALGIWMSSWWWLAGTVLALLAGQIIAWFMLFFGLFQPPKTETGEREGRIAESGPPPIDRGRTEDWI